MIIKKNNMPSLSSTAIMTTRNKQGFTLIELLVVIAVIGIISGVVLQSLGSARIKSRDAARLATIDQLQKTFEVSATVTGTNQLPQSTGYVCLGLINDTAPTCNGSVNQSAIDNPLKAAIANNVIPVDPKFINGWGTAYLYNSNTDPITAPDVTGPGAYLSWSMETNGKCGRGAPAAPLSDRQPCFLRIGNAI